MIKKTFFTLLVILLISITAKSQVLQTNMPFVNGKINSIVRYENTVFIGGEFDSVGGLYKPKLAAFDAITGVVLPWDPQPNDEVKRIIIADDKIVVGGSFSNISGSQRFYMAVFDVATLTLLNSSISYYTTCYALYYDGGNFVYYNSFSQGAVIKRFDINSLNTDSWSSTAMTGIDIYSISGLGNYIYAGGDFTGASGISNLIKKLARFDVTTGMVDTTFYFSWGTNFGWLEEILGYNNKIYITGSFNTIDGLTRKGFAAIDPLTGNVTSLNINSSNQQNYALFPQSNTLWVGGNSAMIGGAYAYRIKQVDINTGMATCWNTLEMSPYSYVKSIWVTNDTVYAGGPMLNANQTFFKVFNGNDSWTTLGPDTTICPGNSYTINADPTFASYLWNTGATTSSITVNSAGNYWVTGTRANNCKATDSIFVDFCSSVNDLNIADIFNVNIYPIPVQDEINISFYSEKISDLNFGLFNSLGQLVDEIIFEKSQIGFNEFKLSTEKLKCGIYFLKIKNNSSERIEKVVKL